MAERIDKIIEILEYATHEMTPPLTSLIRDDFGNDPYVILISCLLSLRSRDITTYPVCKNLFARARTPQEMLALSHKELEKIIHPVNYYRKKALLLKEVSNDLLERFNGQVPKTEKELLSIKGVGPKTAALVLGQAFNIPAICVDTHVHRISNRLGLISTKTAEQTEIELKKIVPQKYWIRLNHLLVMWGQNICVPISPFCSRCALFPLCQRVGVQRSR